jgi:hypothetical protein
MVGSHTEARNGPGWAATCHLPRASLDELHAPHTSGSVVINDSCQGGVDRLPCGRCGCTAVGGVPLLLLHSSVCGGSGQRGVLGSDSGEALLSLFLYCPPSPCGLHSRPTADCPSRTSETHASFSAHVLLSLPPMFTADPGILGPMLQVGHFCLLFNTHVSWYVCHVHPRVQVSACTSVRTC